MKNKKLFSIKNPFVRALGVFLLFVLFIGELNAQVVITDANLPGSGSIIRKANVSSPANFYFPTPDSGANQNWNYNFLQETPYPDTLRFLVPANAPHINQYPQANLVFVTRHNIHYYFQKKTDGLYLIAVESQDFPFRPSKPLMWYKYPLQIGTSFVDSATSVQTFAAPDTTQFDSVKYIQTIVIFANAVADGRITYNGTVAPKVVKERIRSVWKFGTYARDTTTGNWTFLGGDLQERIIYRWTSDKLGFSEVELEYNINEDSVLSLSYVEGAVIKSSSVLFETQSPFKIFPNPVTDYLIIKTPTNEFLNSLEIFDTKGNIIFKEKLEKLNRTQQHTLQLSALPKGIYLLKLNTVHGNSYLHKFIK